jgi:hypothetical protein
VCALLEGGLLQPELRALCRMLGPQATRQGPCRGVSGEDAGNPSGVLGGARIVSAVSGEQAGCPDRGCDRTGAVGRSPLYRPLHRQRSGQGVDVEHRGSAGAASRNRGLDTPRVWNFWSRAACVPCAERSRRPSTRSRKDCLPSPTSDLANTPYKYSSSMCPSSRSPGLGKAYYEWNARLARCADGTAS